MNNNIILIGFMGAGKTTIGKKLAKELGKAFIDTDEVIEKKEKKSVSQIFKEEGEQYFRQLEHNLLKQLFLEEKSYIISVGGGLPIQENNKEILKQLGKCIYLQTSKETIWDRLKNDTTRPLLQGENPIKQIESLMKARASIYENISQHKIITDDKDIKEVTEEIKVFAKIFSDL